MTEPRTGSHRAGVHRAPGSRRRTLLLLLAAAVVVALVATLVVLLLRPGDDGATGGAGPPASDGPLADLADDVAGWVDAELPPDVPLTAPDDVGAALTAAGIAEERLSGEDDGALQVVEGDPGAESVVVAQFDGGDGTLLNVVDPAPVAPTADELDRRRRLAAAVLANPAAGATGRAADVLGSADVDARLLGLVAVLVARLDAGITDLPRAPGQPEQGTPTRSALIGSIGGEEIVPGSEAADRARAFVEAQQPPFAADTVELTEDGLLVGFDYSSSPDADVTAATR